MTVKKQRLQLSQLSINSFSTRIDNLDKLNQQGGEVALGTVWNCTGVTGGDGLYAFSICCL